MNSVGQPLARLDGRLKVTGGAQYTADVPLPGALHGAIVHSTIATSSRVPKMCWVVSKSVSLPVASQLATVTCGSIWL